MWVAIDSTRMRTQATINRGLFVRASVLFLLTFLPFISDTTRTCNMFFETPLDDFMNSWKPFAIAIVVAVVFTIKFVDVVAYCMQNIFHAQGIFSRAAGYTDEKIQGYRRPDYGQHLRNWFGDRSSSSK